MKEKVITCTTKKEACQKKKKKIQHIYEEKCKHKHLPQHAPSRILHFFSWWSLQAEASRVFTHTQIDNKRLKGALLYPSFPDPVTHSLCLLRRDFRLPVNIISDWNPVHPLWQFWRCNERERRPPPTPHSRSPHFRPTRLSQLMNLSTHRSLPHPPPHAECHQF